MEAKLKRKSKEVHEFDHVNKRIKISVSGPVTDRISQLPDDILHQILSFLPQETVEKTIILSKRWLNLWTTLPFLCFNFKPCNHPNYSETNSGLMNFIEKILSFRDKSTFIEKFRLFSSSPNCCLDISRVNIMIREIVLQHRVRELDLKLEHYRLQFCSPFFVSSKSLTSLKLTFDDHCLEPFPTYFSFPNLKTIELKHVDLHKNFASQLGNNCSKLENLVISFCIFVDSKNRVPYNDSGLRTLPSLYKASISLVDFLWEIYVLDFVRVISNVETLSLKVLCAFLEFEQLQLLDYFSKFHNLKNLELGDIYEKEIRFNIMDNILGSLPALEYLSIDLVLYSQILQDGSGLPNCRLSQRLKVVRIGSVYPEKLIIKLVKYFLEEAKGLKRVIVDTPTKLNNKELDIFHQKLQALPNNGALIELYEC